jgi:hypothetical protein
MEGDPMIKEAIPEGLQFREVQLLGSGEESVRGRAAVKAWTHKERTLRGFRISAKMLSPIVLFMLPFAFLEPFLFMIWGSIAMAIVFLVAGPVLFGKYRAEEVSFFYVDGPCPHCHKGGRLSPFLHTEYREEFKVLCPDCGQTVTAVPTGKLE